jgi:hypothetical protein
MKGFDKKRKMSLFSTPIDTHYCKENVTLITQESYEFDENDSHITDLVKTFCETDDYCSENELNTTLDSSKRSKTLDTSQTVEETKVFLIKFKISQLFKENIKEDIAEFKRNLFEHIGRSINYNPTENNCLEKQFDFNKENQTFIQESRSKCYKNLLMKKFR